ncbi:ATP-binding protein [Streptomyces sp. NPDC006393]|uniref:ATP-binding protein n=1 Tax=Streptomyces sp. NPDC006393 TaxID=3156763 RepID=UPI0033D85EED
MASPSPGRAPECRLPPRPQSVSAARGFVRDVLEQSPPDVVDTAQLLVSELVTNAVVHANTEVEVRVWAADGRAHVQVTDHKPSRGLVSQRFSSYASTGRGLGMVEQLASNHGVHVGEDRKTVWFELWSGTAPPPAPGWDTSVTSRGPTVAVTLIDLPGALHKAAQQHREALLRESLLTALSDDRPTALRDDLLTAHECNHMIKAALADAPEQLAAHGDLRTLRVPIPADAAPALRTLDRMLDHAQEAACEGRLLTRPALPQTRAANHWLLDQLISQLAGRPPTAWTSTPHEPSAVPPEPAPWDPSSLQTSRTPTIAADDADRIIAVNTPAAGLLGWPADELVGQRITVLIPENLRERHIAAFTSLLLTGEPRILGRPVTMTALHRDGGLIPISLLIQTQEARDGRSVFVARLAPARDGH